MSFYLLLSLTALGSLLPGTASAAENPQDCAQAYEKAQEEKTAGRLSGAVAYLKACIALECPAFIREDCVRWMVQTEGALPTVVFSVEQDGNDVTDVEILCDNKPLTGKLDGKALPIDPGLHAFSFRMPGHVAIERKILAREGERNRIIKVAFNSSTKLLPPIALSSTIAKTDRQDAPDPRSGKLVPYACTGLGVLGLAGFTTFAILGNSKQGELERTCSPNCRPGQVDSVKTKYLLADVSMGVGLVSLGVATYWWVRNHGKDATERDVATSIDFMPQSAGGVLRLSTSY